MKKSVIILIAVLLVGTVILMNMMHQEEEKPEPENVIQITTDPSSQTSPAIYGDIIVWEDYRNDKNYSDAYFNDDVYMYNLSNGEERQITTDPHAQLSPAIYGDIIVWQDQRNGRGDIYTYNLSTGKETQITTNPAGQGNPAIHKDIIVWEDHRRGYHSIYMYNLSNGEEREVTPTISLHPDVYENIIVWQDKSEDIYMYNLKTRKKTRLTMTDLSESREDHPVVYGTKIIWKEYGGNNSIVMYDITTGDRIDISEASSEGGSPLARIGNEYNWKVTAIYGDKVVWSGPGIWMYDLSTGNKTQITSSSPRWLSIYDNKIVWDDNRNTNWDTLMHVRNPNWDVYMYVIE